MSDKFKGSLLGTEFIIFRLADFHFWKVLREVTWNLLKIQVNARRLAKRCIFRIF